MDGRVSSLLVKGEKGLIIDDLKSDKSINNYKFRLLTQSLNIFNLRVRVMFTMEQIEIGKREIGGGGDVFTLRGMGVRV